MAGGVQSFPPPPLEARSLLLKSSPIGSKPVLSLGSGELPSFKEPSSVISDVHPLEDGEIPPLLAVPSSDRPSPLTLRKPISYSKIVQGHKGVPPISEVISVDPATLCQDPVSLKPVSLFEGKPCVLFKSSEKEMLIKNQKFVLVGKFSHGRPPLSAIKVFFAALKLQGRYNLSIFDNKHLFIELDLKIDYIMIWLKLSWKITGFEMRIFKWDCDFTPVKESAIAPVWIRIEGVPLYLFDKMSLLSIANAIGNPLSVHPLNVSRVKLNSAIICVELDVSKILMDSIFVCFEDDCSLRPVEGFWLKVFYDALPPFCTSCFHLGHLFDVCKKGSTVSGVGFTAPVARTEQPKTALQVFDALPQQNNLAISAQIPVLDVPSSSTAHLEKQGKHTQVWIGSKGTGVLKSQLHNSRYKDQALSLVNSFRVLEVEQKEGTLKESSLEHSAKADTQAELLISALTSAVPVVGSSGAALDVSADGDLGLDPVVHSSAKYKLSAAQASGRQAAEGSAIPVDLVIPAEACQILPSPVADFPTGKSGVALTVLQPCSLGSFEKAGTQATGLEQSDFLAAVSSSDQIEEFVPVGSLSNSWANMVDEEEQEVKNIALLKAKTVDISSNILVTSTGLDTIKDLIMNPGKDNFTARVAQKDQNEGLALKNKSKTSKRVDTKRYISKDDSQVDEFSFSQGNPRTDLPPALGRYFISPEGIQIDLNECKEAGYRLIARRSLSPPGRSSPKLILCGKR